MISIQTVDSSRIKTLEIKGKIIQNQENQKDLLKLIPQSRYWQGKLTNQYGN